MEVGGNTMKFVSAVLACLILVGCAENSVPTPLTIVTSSVPAADLNKIYAQQITVTGGVAPYIFSVTQGKLPAGITLGPQGVLSGIPTVSGDFSFTIQVIDSNKQAAQIQIQERLNEIT